MLASTNSAGVMWVPSQTVADWRTSTLRLEEFQARSPCFRDIGVDKRMGEMIYEIILRSIDNS